MTSESSYPPADQLVVSVSVEGITIKMSGDKRLLAVRIPPEILAEWRPERLGKVLTVAVNRARAVADMEAGRVTFLGLAGEELAQHLLDDAAAKPEVMQRDHRPLTCPQLLAGVQVLLAERGWTLADLAERSGLDEEALRNLLAGVYFPLAVAEEHSGQLRLVMDLASPLALSFGVSPEEVWRRGTASLLEFERATRIRIKRQLNGFKRAKRRRKIGSKETERLRLGALDDAGVGTRVGLEAAILNENVVEARRGLGDWLHVTRRGGGDDDCGPLLAPDGGILRESISEASYQELMQLDRKAAREPESLTAAELDRARELSGIPTLQVVGMAADEVA